MRTLHFLTRRQNCVGRDRPSYVYDSCKHFLLLSVLPSFLNRFSSQLSPWSKFASSPFIDLEPPGQSHEIFLRPRPFFLPIFSPFRCSICQPGFSFFSGPFSRECVSENRGSLLCDVRAKQTFKERASRQTEVVKYRRRHDVPFFHSWPSNAGWTHFHSLPKHFFFFVILSV